MKPSWSAALLSMAAVGLMGFAIQRGGTCMVAAVDEIVMQRRAHRMAAMLEASLWVVGCLALAQLAHWSGSMPTGHVLSHWAVVGGALLGLGAWVNGACVFGAIARLGTGQWAQALTPVGFFIGCLTVNIVFFSAEQTPPEMSTAWPWWSAAAWLAPAFLLYAAWRVGLHQHIKNWRKPDFGTRLATRIWAPHAATMVIGATFAITLLLAGSWAYTDVLAQLARSMTANDWTHLMLPVLLLIALYAGAFFGGWTAGRWRAEWPTLSAWLRAFIGGALMGWGSLLIPGSNDGLIFIGIPLLRPYAWAALASMALAIAALVLLQQAMMQRPKAVK